MGTVSKEEFIGKCLQTIAKHKEEQQNQKLQNEREFLSYCRERSVKRRRRYR
jgi:hypothetical protein